ncbi:MAG: ankyrin repeat domain-containing protein [Bryobacteraceae bacterium]
MAAAVRPGLAQQSKPAAEPMLDSEKFRRAAVAGDLSTVHAMLDRDPGLLYARDAHGMSVFILASLAGKKPVAEALRSRGLVLDFFEAVTAGDRDRVVELAKISPGFARARAADGRTPLHYACAAGQVSMIMYLPTLGGDLSAAPGSPLIDLLRDAPDAAAIDGAQAMLGNASNPNAVGVDGVTALQLAVKRGFKPIVQTLLRKGATPTPEAAVLAGVVARDYYGGRHPKPLPETGIPQDWINSFAVAAHTDLDQVKRLSKLCPELALTRATFDEMAVEAGAHMGRPDIVDHLVGIGAPISTCTASMMDDTKLLRQLLVEDPQRVRERGAHDFPLLFYPAFGKELTANAEALLDAGADVNMHVLGSSTLHICAQNGHIEFAKLLIDRGANVNAKTRRGTTPLAAAKAAKQEKAAQYLASRGGTA